MSKALNFIKLARLDKPIGIYLLLWPSILGLLVAGINNEITLKSFIIVVLGSIIVRSCGCVVNAINLINLLKEQKIGP
jgi:4-hydroxybenzoate polyprenyltransferase